MFLARAAALILGVLIIAGCGGGRTADTGLRLSARITSGGQPVEIPPGEEVTVSLMSSAGKRHILYRQPDDTFVWPRLDIDGPALKPGAYYVMIARSGRPGKGSTPPSTPDRLTIEDGRLEYAIEVGKTWAR